MAVGIRIKLPGVNQEQFDKVNEHVNASGGLAKGMIFHASGPIDEGWGVIDFWESRADFDAFFGSRVKAAVDATGVEMSGAPDIKEFPVHEYIKG
jgi:heme-degrading monooxygenase HmoA